MFVLGEIGWVVGLVFTSVCIAVNWDMDFLISVVLPVGVGGET